MTRWSPPRHVADGRLAGETNSNNTVLSQIWTHNLEVHRAVLYYHCITIMPYDGLENSGNEFIESMFILA